MEVTLTPPAWATHLISDLTDWLRRPLPVARLLPFTLPDDAYFEYAYLDAKGRPRPDPENPHPSRNPWWDCARSLEGPDYRPDPHAEIGMTRPLGQLLRLTISSQVLGQERRIIVYSPPGQAEARLPLVYIQDGKGYLRYGRVPQVFDRLVSDGLSRPAHLVFVTPRERVREYVQEAAYLRFLVEELLPAVERRVRTTGERVAMGASLGGLMSATLAWAPGELFQTVVAQSGAFLTSPGERVPDAFRGAEWMRRQVVSEPPRPLRWYLDCGTLEWLLPCNDRLAEALRDRGYELDYRNRSAGHNWTNWRNGLAAALQFALPV